MFIDKENIAIGNFSGTARLIYQDYIYHDLQVKDKVKRYFLIQKGQTLNFFFRAL